MFGCGVGGVKYSESWVKFFGLISRDESCWFRVLDRD